MWAALLYDRCYGIVFTCLPQLVCVWCVGGDWGVGCVWWHWTSSLGNIARDWWWLLNVVKVDECYLDRYEIAVNLTCFSKWEHWKKIFFKNLKLKKYLKMLLGVLQKYLWSRWLRIWISCVLEIFSSSVSFYLKLFLWTGIMDLLSIFNCD